MNSEIHEEMTNYVAVTLRNGINARGVTLSWLHEQLKARGNSVSMATLSYWRSGARRPEGAQSLAALRDIELLLDLASGALTDQLSPTRRTGPFGRAQFPLDANELEAAVAETFAAFGAVYPEPSRELTTHSVTEVGAEGFPLSTITRSIVQATTGTITSIPFLIIEADPDSPVPLFSAVSGGRMTRHYSHPGGEVHGSLFELDAPLTAPDTAVVEWMMAHQKGARPPLNTGHALARKCNELMVWTKFHPDALPLWLEEHLETPRGVKIKPLQLTGNAVHQVHRGFGPGAVGLQWGYEPRDL